MQPNLPFLSAASNALLKPGGLLRWNKRLVKDARLTSPLLDAPRQSSSRPRLRHGRRLALLSHLGLTLNLYTFSFVLSLALLPRLPPLLTSPNCSSPRESASAYAAYLRSHFSVSQPKALRSRARVYLTELGRATCSEESHSCFCSPFSLVEFHAAASNLSSSSATGPDKVSYPMLKHLPGSGMDFLLHIFNLSRSSHFFPSIWKTSSIHKMGKPLDSFASFWPISLTFCVSKLFERIILFRLLFFLESNSILSPRQAGFRLGRSTLDQILYLCQSISDGFNKPWPGSRTILSTIDFCKAFDSVWHPAHFHKLISAGLPPCFARWTQSFLSDRRACVVYQNHQTHSFRVRRGVLQVSVLGSVLFSLFIIDLLASLPSSVNCSLYADDLAI